MSENPAPNHDHLLPDDEWAAVQERAAKYGLEDLNANGIPDSLEDLNRNGIPDSEETA